MNGLTREQILAMEPGRELSEIVIREVMNLKIVPSESIFWDKKDAPFPLLMWNDNEGWCLYEDADDEGWSYRWFNPSEDIAAAFEVEEKIAQMEGALWIGHYMTELLLIVGGNGFKMVHATPEQRCKAALLAVMDV